MFASLISEYYVGSVLQTYAVNCWDRTTNVQYDS